VKALLTLGVAALLLGSLSLAVGVVAGQRLAAAAGTDEAQIAEAAPAATQPPTPAPATAAPMPTPTPVRGASLSFAGLQAQVGRVLAADGASGGVSLVQLAGARQWAWSLNGDQRFAAASTYKLPLLMEEAQDIAAGRSRATDTLCYEDGDWEDGYFSDYQSGDCFSRAELDRRAGTYSDNTAAHILVRYRGGTDALNAYARAHGASESAFYDPNVTTSNDLARLWLNEASGGAGGAAARAYLYPLLTNTAYEEGIPAGVPAGTTVVHKIGILDTEVNDAALVESGPRGPYVLAVCTEGGGWTTVAAVAATIARFESSPA
jgi:beta-lactamase class A